MDEIQKWKDEQVLDVADIYVATDGDTVMQEIKEVGLFQCVFIHL